ncbi:SDR family NAD(P)-dependent oxidoreductase, partial [Acinetobacter baumannii]|uniref:SDR family NAD(P)-dependent oxidoreductase n=1 Tax=Acinetobacter baumannii TaxID=470 RepID=UPI0026EA23C6
MNFDGKQVLVVGGSSGIGEAAARAFVERGVTVNIGSSDSVKLAASAARIGQGVRTGVMDIT